MTSELIQPTDRPTQLLGSVLGDKETVRRLIINEHNKDPIITEGIQKKINGFSPQEKISLVKGIFTSLSDGDPMKQDQRDAGLEMLRLVDLTNLPPQEFNEIVKHYSKTVSELKEAYKPDPFGEIDALLEAGKVIAPYILNSGHKMILVTLWKQIASRFKGDENKYILEKLKEITNSIHPSTNNPSKHSEFDKQVEGLALQYLSNKDIAQRLTTTRNEVKNAIARLRTKGITLPLWRGRTTKIDYSRVNPAPTTLRSGH